MSLNKEVLKQVGKVTTTKFGIEVKPFLSSPELGIIVADCSQIDDVVARKKVIDEYILKICAGIEVKDVEEYDLLKYNGVIQDIYNSIENVDEVGAFIYEANQIGNVMRTSLNFVISKLPDEKGLAKIVKNLTKQIKEQSKQV